MQYSPISFDPENPFNPNEFCDGWLANSCQQEFNLCATLGHRDFIDNIINTCSMFGDITEPIIWTDWSALSGVPNNVDGVGGYDLVISFLNSAWEGCDIFMSEALVQASLDLICNECITDAATNCCD